jgi:tRNA pseudouridine38-40 synthase
MAHYQAVLAYDGTDYLGYQRQANDIEEPSTIQGVVERALRQIGWGGQSILAAGRTDTGVHASGQVIAFDIAWRHTLEALMSALNANLPQDIVVRSIKQADAGFHPRYDAQARRYCYRIFCQPVRDPLKERFAWRVWPDVSIECLREAAAHLLGEHDFCAFGSSPRVGGSTIRKVFKADWLDEKADLVFEIAANAFLYHMVRRLVSFQVKIGQGKLNINQVLENLDNRSRLMVQGLAPPQGLTLVEVIYSLDSVFGIESGQ